MTKNLVFCSGYNAPTIFLIQQRGLKSAGSVALSKRITDCDPLSGFLYYNLKPLYV